MKFLNFIRNNFERVLAYDTEFHFDLTKTIPQKVLCFCYIDIFTGNSFLFEYKEPYSLLSNTYNELARFLSIYKSREIILIYNVGEEDLYKITQYIDIGNVKQHHINLIHTDETENYELALKCEKQNYIKSTFYRSEAWRANCLSEVPSS